MILSMLLNFIIKNQGSINKLHSEGGNQRADWKQRGHTDEEELRSQGPNLAGDSCELAAGVML